MLGEMASKYLKKKNKPKINNSKNTARQDIHHLSVDILMIPMI